MNNISWATAKDLINGFGLAFIWYQFENQYWIYINFEATGFLCIIPLTLSPSADQVEFETYYKDRTKMPSFSATASATIGNSSSEESLVGTGTGSMNVPADALIAGSRLRIQAWGLFTSIVDPGNVTINLKFGSTVLNTITFGGPWGYTNRLWRAEALVTCRASGVSGSVFSQMESSHAFVQELKNTATITVDTTQDQQLDLTWQWETADAGNIVTCTNLALESWT